MAHGSTEPVSCAGSGDYSSVGTAAGGRRPGAGKSHQSVAYTPVVSRHPSECREVTLPRPQSTREGACSHPAAQDHVEASAPTPENWRHVRGARQERRLLRATYSPNQPYPRGRSWRHKTLNIEGLPQETSSPEVGGCVSVQPCLAPLIYEEQQKGGAMTSVWGNKWLPGQRPKDINNGAQRFGRDGLSPEFEACGDAGRCLPASRPSQASQAAERPVASAGGLYHDVCYAVTTGPQSGCHVLPEEYIERKRRTRNRFISGSFSGAQADHAKKVGSSSACPLSAELNRDATPSPAEISRVATVTHRQQNLTRPCGEDDVSIIFPKKEFCNAVKHPCEFPASAFTEGQSLCPTHTENGTAAAVRSAMPARTDSSPRAADSLGLGVEFPQQVSTDTCEDFLQASLQQAFALTAREASSIVAKGEGIWTAIRQLLDKEELEQDGQGQTASAPLLQAQSPGAAYSSPFWVSYRSWLNVMLSAEGRQPPVKHLAHLAAMDLEKIPLILQMFSEGIFEDSLQAPDDLRHLLIRILEAFLCAFLSRAGTRGSNALFVSIFKPTCAKRPSRLGRQLATLASEDIPATQSALMPISARRTSFSHTRHPARTAKQKRQAHRGSRGLTGGCALAEAAARSLSLLASADPLSMWDKWLHGATYGDDEAYCNVCRRLLHVHFGGRCASSTWNNDAQESQQEGSGFEYWSQRDQWITVATRMLRLCVDELSLLEVTKQDTSTSSAVGYIRLAGDLLRFCGPVFVPVSGSDTEDKRRKTKRPPRPSDPQRLLLHSLTCMGTALRHRCAAVQHAAENEISSILQKAMQSESHCSGSSSIGGMGGRGGDGQESSTACGIIVPLLWKSGVLRWEAAGRLETPCASLDSGSVDLRRDSERQIRRPCEERLLVLFGDLLAGNGGVNAVLSEALLAFGAARPPMHPVDERILGAFLCDARITLQEAMEILQAVETVYFKTFEELEECSTAPRDTAGPSKMQGDHNFSELKEDTRGGDVATRRIVLSLIVLAASNTAALCSDVGQFGLWLKNFLQRDMEKTALQTPTAKEHTCGTAGVAEVMEGPETCPDLTKCRDGAGPASKLRSRSFAAAWLLKEADSRYAGRHPSPPATVIGARRLPEKQRLRPPPDLNQTRESSEIYANDTAALEMLRRLCKRFRPRFFRGSASACSQSKLARMTTLPPADRGIALPKLVNITSQSSAETNVGPRFAAPTAKQEDCDSQCCIRRVRPERAPSDSHVTAVSPFVVSPGLLTAHDSVTEKLRAPPKRELSSSTRCLRKATVSHAKGGGEPCPTISLSESAPLPEYLSRRDASEGTRERKETGALRSPDFSSVSTNTALDTSVATTSCHTHEPETDAHPSEVMCCPSPIADFPEVNCPPDASTSTARNAGGTAVGKSCVRESSTTVPNAYATYPMVGRGRNASACLCRKAPGSTLSGGAVAQVVRLQRPPCDSPHSSVAAADLNPTCCLANTRKRDTADQSSCCSSRTTVYARTCSTADCTDTRSSADRGQLQRLADSISQCSGQAQEARLVESSLHYESSPTNSNRCSEQLCTSSVAGSGGTSVAYTRRSVSCQRPRSCGFVVEGEGNNGSLRMEASARRWVSLSEPHAPSTGQVPLLNLTARERSTQDDSSAAISDASARKDTLQEDAGRTAILTPPCATPAGDKFAQNEDRRQEEQECKDVLDSFERSLSKLYACLQSPEEANSEAPITLSSAVPRILRAFGFQRDARTRSAVTALAELLKKHCRRNISASPASLRRDPRDQPQGPTRIPHTLAARVAASTSPPGYLSFRELQLLTAQLAFSQHVLKLYPSDGTSGYYYEEALQSSRLHIKPRFSSALKLLNLFRRLKQAAESPGSVFGHLKGILQKDEQRLWAKLTKRKLGRLSTRVNQGTPAEHVPAGPAPEDLTDALPPAHIVWAVTDAVGEPGETRILMSCTPPGSRRSTTEARVFNVTASEQTVSGTSVQLLAPHAQGATNPEKTNAREFAAGRRRPRSHDSTTYDGPRYAVSGERQDRDSMHENSNRPEGGAPQDRRTRPLVERQTQNAGNVACEQALYFPPFKAETESSAGSASSQPHQGSAVESKETAQADEEQSQGEPHGEGLLNPTYNNCYSQKQQKQDQDRCPRSALHEEQSVVVAQPVQPGRGRFVPTVVASAPANTLHLPALAERGNALHNDAFAGNRFQSRQLARACASEGRTPRSRQALRTPSDLSEVQHRLLSENSALPNPITQANPASHVVTEGPLGHATRRRGLSRSGLVADVSAQESISSILKEENEACEALAPPLALRCCDDSPQRLDRALTSPFIIGTSSTQACVKSPSLSSPPQRQQSVSQALPKKQNVFSNNQKCGKPEQAFRGKSSILQASCVPVHTTVAKSRMAKSIAEKNMVRDAKGVNGLEQLSAPVSHTPHPALGRLLENRKTRVAMRSHRKEERRKVDIHLQSKTVQTTLDACGSGLHMIFTGFSDPPGTTIPQKMWFKFVSCFNLLPQKQMTLIYRRGIPWCAAEEALSWATSAIRCAMQKETSDHVANALKSVLYHMKADDPKILRKRLHDFFAFGTSYPRLDTRSLRTDANGFDQQPSAESPRLQHRSISARSAASGTD